jgi:hypothetical protein
MDARRVFLLSDDPTDRNAIGGGKHPNHPRVPLCGGGTGRRMRHQILRRTPRYGQASFQQLLHGISWHWHRPVAPVLRHGARHAVPVL